MAEYINRDTFLEKERAWYCENCDMRKNSKGKLVYEIGDAPCRACRINDILDEVENCPAADVVERKTGKWIYPSDIIGFGRCSECKALWNYSLMINKFFKICPRCGSYNRGENDV